MAQRRDPPARPRDDESRPRRSRSQPPASARRLAESSREDEHGGRDGRRIVACTRCVTIGGSQRRMIAGCLRRGPTTHASLGSTRGVSSPVPASRRSAALGERSRLRPRERRAGARRYATGLLSSPEAAAGPDGIGAMSRPQRAQRIVPHSAGNVPRIRRSRGRETLARCGSATWSHVREGHSRTCPGRGWVRWPSADDDPATSRLPVRVPVGGVRLGGAGGEQAEVVGQGAVGEVGDACAKDGDRLGR
jgi:hypothetical protein